MTSKERMLLAIRNQQPDRVPVAPDMSNMIPAKFTGKPFWDVYYHNNPPLWKGYLQALDYFKFDAWAGGGIGLKYESQVTTTEKIIRQTPELLEVEYVHHTPAGDLRHTTEFPKDNPPWTKFFVNLKEDFEKVKYLSTGSYTSYTGYDDTNFKEMRKQLGDRGVIGIGLPTPGFHLWTGMFPNGLMDVTYAYYDYPELFEELADIQHRDIMKMVEMIIRAKPDFILTGGSGALTLSSPELYRKFGLRTLKETARMAKEAGIPTMIHCCGKARALAQMAAEETDINCINPLEGPPQGDCDLKEIKRLYGSKISLMGNINTTLMLKGTPTEIESAAKQCIDDAAENGGFILSTGDQCGRDTPYENIFKMIEVAQTYGRYK